MSSSLTSPIKLQMYVYILKSEKDHSFYVGSTKNVEKRLAQHNNGYSLSTKAKRPWLLMRIEEYKDNSLAIKRERFLKSSLGRDVVKNLCKGVGTFNFG